MFVSRHIKLFRVRARLLVLGQASQDPTRVYQLPKGAIRREPVRKTVPRNKKAITMDVFNRVCKRGALAGAATLLLEESASTSESIVHHLRFPSAEFRSLALNPLGRSSSMCPFPDRGTWNRHKVALVGLVLQLADDDEAGFMEKLHALVELTLERDAWQSSRADKDPAVPDEQRLKLKAKLESRRFKMTNQFESWCRATVTNPHFALLRPVLQQVLEVEPAPMNDIRRDGAQTETAIAALLQRELPPGWRLYGQARVTHVDGEVFKNVKMLKGEADMLIVDPSGIVQAIVEIKTAKGNPYLALYEDVTRFSALLERVHGRLVSFQPTYMIQGESEGHSTTCIFDNAPSTLMACPGVGNVVSSQAAAAFVQSAMGHELQHGLGVSSSSEKGEKGGAAFGSVDGEAGGKSSSSGSSSEDEGAASTSTPTPATSNAPLSVTLRFSKTVRPVYVLGSSIAAEDLGPVVRSAQSKLLTMEFGRMLSTQIDAWRDVSLVELTPASAVLQVPESSIPQCASAVRQYFENLQACDIYMVSGV